MPSIAPLAGEALALPTIALVTVWWIVGLPMMLLGAAAVPQDICEAAAQWHHRRHTFVSITAVSRTHLALVAVIRVILQFQLFRSVATDDVGQPEQLLAVDGDVHL